MKIRKNYTIMINPYTQCAIWGNIEKYTSNNLFSSIIDCTLSELKHNIRLLMEHGIIVIRR